MSPIPDPPKKPKFITDITWGQKLIAGISGSMFLMALITLIPWFINAFFAPNYLLFLSTLRMIMACTSLILGGWVGVPQIKGMIDWIFDFYEYYNKFKEFKDQDKKK